MSKTRLNLTIDEELKMQLKIIAIKEKKTVSEIITEMIIQYIDEHG